MAITPVPVTPALVVSRSTRHRRNTGSAALLALVPLALLASCGDPRTGDEAARSPSASESRVSDWQSAPVESRFSAEEMAGVYSTGTKVVGDKTYPDSKAPLKFVYSPANAPAAFKTAYAPFTAGTEIKGYVNLGLLPTQEFQSRLVANLEQVSRWKTIRDAKGEPLFEDAYSTDARGTKVADVSDGVAPEAGETSYAQLKFRTGTIAGALPIPARITLHGRQGEIQLDLVNHREVRAPIVGTLIPAGGLKIHMKAYPHEKGWLVYAASAVKMDKFQDAIEPELLASLTDALFTWIKDETVLPL